MKIQCLSSENFLTLVMKMPPVFERTCRWSGGSWRWCSTSIFLKRVEWSSSWPQLVKWPLPKCWHPDWRKKPPLWQCSHQLLPQQTLRVPSFFFSLKWRTCTVQILRSFCSSLEYHSTNPKIGDCSLTAASNHWNVFCYTTANSLPITHLTTLKEKYEAVKYVLEEKLVISA